MKRVILFLSFVVFVGCSSNPSYRDLKGSYQQNKKHLELRDSFAFYHDGHEYYFAQKKDKVGKENCFTIIGFKDGNVSYTFPSSRFSELESIYDLKATPEERIRLTVSRLEKFQRDQKDKHCVQTGMTADDIGYAIVFSPLLVYIVPLLYIKDITNDIDDLLVNFDDIRLGMSFEKVKQFANDRPFSTLEDNGVKVYILDKANQRLVMYFKNEKLYAWVRGYKPQGDSLPMYHRAR